MLLVVYDLDNLFVGWLAKSSSTDGAIQSSFASQGLESQMVKFRLQINAVPMLESMFVVRAEKRGQESFP